MILKYIEKAFSHARYEVPATQGITGLSAVSRSPVNIGTNRNFFSYTGIPSEKVAGLVPIRQKKSKKNYG